MKDSFALLDIYIQSHKIDKAYPIIHQITLDHGMCDYGINESYYMLYKAEGKYKEALHYKEICSNILDSITLAQNKMRMLEIEQKYHNMKVREENERLKNMGQTRLNILIVALSLLLLSVSTYIIYRQKTQTLLYKQDAKLKEIQITLLHLSAELKEKKQALQEAIDRVGNYEILQKEVENLSRKYCLLQEQQLLASSVGRKLHQLVRKNVLEASQTLCSDKSWKPLIAEIDRIFPHFYISIKNICPVLTEQDWQYCCLHVFGFDSNDEAKLLNINPDSVRMKRSRIKQKMNGEFEKNTALRDILKGLAYKI